MCLSQFSQFSESGSSAVYSFYFAQQQCETGDGTGTPVTEVRAVLDENEMRLLKENIPPVESNATRPSIQDRPDRDLCQTLAYQNPDHIKEAKRRGLTDAKCREILGN